MSPMNEALKRELYSCRGGWNPALQGELDRLSPEGARLLCQIIRDLKQEVQTAEHTYRPFPGGPKMRM